MNSNAARRASIIIGGIMLFAMVLSAISPLITNIAQNASTPQATTVPTATLPAPVDINAISFAQNYMHTSGLFTVAQPTGWTVSQVSNNGTQVQVNFNNQNALSVIEAYIDTTNLSGNATLTPPPTPSLDTLSAYFTRTVLGQGWQRYTGGWEETSRTIDPVNNRLSINFTLKLGQQQYIARHIAWTDGQWIYVIRVVVPENAPKMLDDLIEKMIPTLKPIKLFNGTPIAWNAYFDQSYRYIIRYPSDWTVDDSGPGLPATINSPTTVLRLEAQDGNLKDENGVKAWLNAARPDATVVNIAPADRDTNKGFSVAYSYKNPDGETESGYAVLLNGDNNKIYVANLRVLAPNVNLNDPAVDKDKYGNLVQIMGTFRVMPDMNLVPLPTPTPIPTVPTLPPTNTPEATTEATGEATAEVTGEATQGPEGTAEVTAEATHEATAEVTAQAASVQKTPEVTATAAPTETTPEATSPAAPSAEATVAVQPTEQPSNTPAPSETPKPTDTATATNTATPTQTPTSTNTATATATNTATATQSCVLTPVPTREATSEATAEVTPKVTLAATMPVCTPTPTATTEGTPEATP